MIATVKKSKSLSSEYLTVFESMMDTAFEILPMEAAGGDCKEESSQNKNPGIVKAGNQTTLLNCVEQSNQSEMLGGDNCFNQSRTAIDKLSLRVDDISEKQ